MQQSLHSPIVPPVPSSSIMTMINSTSSPSQQLQQNNSIFNRTSAIHPHHHHNSQPQQSQLFGNLLLSNNTSNNTSNDNITGNRPMSLQFADNNYHHLQQHHHPHQLHGNIGNHHASQHPQYRHVNNGSMEIHASPATNNNNNNINNNNHCKVKPVFPIASPATNSPISHTLNNSNSNSGNNNNVIQNSGNAGSSNNPSVPGNCAVTRGSSENNHVYHQRVNSSGVPATGLVQSSELKFSNGATDASNGNNNGFHHHTLHHSPHQAGYRQHNQYQQDNCPTVEDRTNTSSSGSSFLGDPTDIKPDVNGIELPHSTFKSDVSVK